MILEIFQAQTTLTASTLLQRIPTTSGAGTLTVLNGGEWLQEFMQTQPVSSRRIASSVQETENSEEND